MLLKAYILIRQAETVSPNGAEYVWCAGCMYGFGICRVRECARNSPKAVQTRF